MHHARAGDGYQRIVDDRQMVRGDDGTAFTRHVLQSDRRRSHTTTGNPTETFDKEPVQHDDTSHSLTVRLITVGRYDRSSR